MVYRFVLGCLVILCASGFFITGSNADTQNRRPRVLDPSKYLKWVESKNSGLTAVSENGALTYAVMYRPSEYVILKGTPIENKRTAGKEIKQRIKEIKGVEHYTFSIALNDGRKDLIKTLTRDSREYEALLLYLANQMQHDLQLATGKDTTGCTMFHMERTYGVTPYVKFVLGFEMPVSGKELKEDRTILFNAEVLGSGLIRLNIRKEDIQSIPKVDYKG